MRLYRPTMSSTLLAEAGWLERLKVRRRCGCRRLTFQMRCTALKLMPTTLATARPVQCVTAPGGVATGVKLTRSPVES